MTSYSEYFSKITYKPKYTIGDRVRGKWENIPLSGTVQIDTMIDEFDGPYVIVLSDLPIKDKSGFYRTLVKVKPADINFI